jgi:hypothetical protein
MKFAKFFPLKKYFEVFECIGEQGEFFWKYLSLTLHTTSQEQARATKK